MSSSTSNGWDPFRKKLWNLSVPRKIKFFCWRAMNDIIPTHLNLKRRGVNADLTYPTCNGGVKSIDHTLFRCPRVRDLWGIIHPSANLMANFNNSFRDRWMVLSLSCDLEKLSLIAITCRAIWNDRNSLRL